MGLEQLKVEYNHHDGDDLTVVNAARRSFGKKSEWGWQSWAELHDREDSFEGWQQYHGAFRRLKPQDCRLINFLARGMSGEDFEALVCDLQEGTPCQDMELQRKFVVDRLWEWRNTPIHDTPFNHCHISFEVKAPIFVARQLVKTEYALWSEFSARYMPLDEFYEHDYRKQAESRKQGSTDQIHPYNDGWKLRARVTKRALFGLYQDMVDDGVAIEQARGVLPLDTMTAWTWSATLGAFAKMCRERLGSDAQAETRHVAGLIYDQLKRYYPVSAPALVEGPR